MKPKLLYISDRPSMSADMLIKNLDEVFEITRARSGDDVAIPKIILVNLAGLESTERIGAVKNSKVFLLGNKAEIDSAMDKFTGAEFFVKPFNAKEIRSQLLELTQNNNGGTMKTILLVDDQRRSKRSENSRES